MVDSGSRDMSSQSITVWDKNAPGAKAMIRRQLAAKVGFKRSKQIERAPARYLVVCFLDHAKVKPGDISHAHASTELSLGLLLTEIITSIPGRPRVPILHHVLPEGLAVIEQVIKEQMEEVTAN
jgi:hypothetical protein